MFTTIISHHYLKEQGKEHFWSSGEEATTGLLAGSLLSSDIG